MDDTITLDIKATLIKQQACFSELSLEEATELANMLLEKHVLTGETIVNEGDLVDSVYLIVSGTAEVQHLSIQNNQLHVDTVATLNAGQTIGLNEVGFYSLNGIRTATVVAISNMVLLKLKVATFHGFALTHPHVIKIMRKNTEDILEKK